MFTSRWIEQSHVYCSVADILLHGRRFGGDVSTSARNRTWSSTFAGSRASPAHPKDSVVQQPAEESDPVLQNRSLPCGPAHSQAIASVARPGIEPGPAASEAAVLSGTPTGHSVVSTPTWSRTRTKTFAASRAVRYTIGTIHLQSRRLDSHQHEPAYKADAFLHRATPAYTLPARRPGARSTLLLQRDVPVRRDLHTTFISSCLDRRGAEMGMFDGHGKGGQGSPSYLAPEGIPINRPSPSERTW